MSITWRGPSVGATLVFASCLVFVNGLLIITARMLDARRTFIIGLSFMLGLSVDVLPAMFAELPAGVRLFTGSSLLLGTLTALILNLVFRVGVRRNATMTVEPDSIDPIKIEQFMELQGAAWGARRDVIDRTRFNLIQSIDTLAASGVASGPFELSASFDEFRLDVRISYAGMPLELPAERPSPEEIVESDAGERRLAGFLLRRFADRVSATQKDGRATILFHFDH
jgi:xanthine permease XanP